MFSRFKVRSVFENCCSVSVVSKRFIYFRNNLILRSADSRLNFYRYSKQSVNKYDLSFNNGKEAFKSKTNWELFRGYFVYQLCSIEFLVKHHVFVLKAIKKLLGTPLYEKLMKLTAYGHFVAGEDHEKIQPTIKKMNRFGVSPILDYSVEEDLSEEEAVKIDFEATVSEFQRKRPIMTREQFLKCKKEGDKSEACTEARFQSYQEFGDRRKSVSSARTYFYLNEGSCDRNLEIFQQCIKTVGTGKFGWSGISAVKLTALGRPQLLLQISEVIMKARKFVADVTDQQGPRNVLQFHLTEAMLVKRLEKHGIQDTQAFLKNVVKDKEGVMHLFPWNGIIDKNFNLSETFRIPSLKEKRMVRLITQLSATEEQMFRNMIERFNKLIATAKEYDVPIMVDAEQTYFQPAISRITMEMMHKYNTEKMMVMNTYQCYLKETFNEVQNDLEQARRENFYFGAKLVRGAYLQQERERAAEIGYDDPTNPTYEDTTAMYNRTVDLVMKHIVANIENKEKKKVKIMIATHNEDTIQYVLKKMKQANIEPSDELVTFAQLLGMCDFITFPLGQAGYPVYKYVPYGPVAEVLPYLSRRVVENKGVLKKTKKEKGLLLQELTRRLSSGQLFYKPPKHA